MATLADTRTRKVALYLFGVGVQYAVGYMVGLNVYGFAGGAAVGVVLTLPPFFMARRNGLEDRANDIIWAGVFVGGLGGALLALPMSICLSVLVHKRGRTSQSDRPPNAVPADDWGRRVEASRRQRLVLPGDWLVVCPGCGKRLLVNAGRCDCGSECSPVTLPVSA